MMTYFFYLSRIRLFAVGQHLSAISKRLLALRIHQTN